MASRKSRTPHDGRAGRALRTPKTPPRRTGRKRKPSIVRPLLKVQLRGWPPDDLTRKERVRLAMQLTRDLQKTLISLASGPACVPKPARVTAMRFDGSSEAGTAEAANGGDGGVDCHRTAVGYEIVEIDGVPTRCRVEYFTCTDGSTFRRVFPLE